MLSHPFFQKDYLNIVAFLTGCLEQNINIGTRRNGYTKSTWSKRQPEPFGHFILTFTDLRVCGLTFWQVEIGYCSKKSLYGEYALFQILVW